VGPGTRALAALEPGDAIHALGPLGRGFRLDVPRPLLVGGGIGIAPLTYLSEALERPPAVLGFRSAHHAEAAALVPNAEVVIDPVLVTDAASHCVLLYHPPLSQIGRQRLGIMRETNDGFVIAEKDLELRGPGEMLGTRQTGLLQFKVADLMRDADLLPAVRDAAQALLERWPDHVSPLLDRWLRHGQQYGQV
ncbi:MAG: ATP-dependent helicase RecG, partial [Pseudomonas sp.]|nr:ATP-dependent helicase RecG [Pseudomonas sp.]